MDQNIGWLDLVGDAYHADRRHESHSTLECFRKSSLLYHGVYIKKDIPRPTGEHFDLGQAFDTYLLTPGDFPKLFVTAPARWDLRTKSGKDTYKEFEDKIAQGRKILWPLEFDQLCFMVDGVFRNKAAVELLKAQGVAQKAIHWLDPATGVPCKCMFDWLVTDSSHLSHAPNVRPTALVDLKTSRDSRPKEWAKQAGNLGYHRQDAFYSVGALQVFAVDVPFYFVVVGKEPPYECNVYHLANWQRNTAITQNTEDLSRLSFCREFDQWHDEGAILDLEIPGWALD